MDSGIVSQALKNINLSLFSITLNKFNFILNFRIKFITNYKFI